MPAGRGPSGELVGQDLPPPIGRVAQEGVELGEQPPVALQGGFARYFAELAPLLAGSGSPDFEALAAVQARYRLTMDPTTIAPLCERFGLRR